MSSDNGSSDERGQNATGISESSKGTVINLAPRAGANIRI